MKLYPKKLRTLEDLEREKDLLIRERRLLDKEEFFSLEGVLGKKSGGKKKSKKVKEEYDNDDEGGGSGSVADLLSFLPVSNPMVSMGIKLVQSWMASRSKRTAREEVYTSQPTGKGKHPVRTVAIEIIGGYLKWKAIELSYKGIKHIIKKRKENKASSMPGQ